MDDGVGSLKSPTNPYPEICPQWESRRKHRGQTASNKRREFSSGMRHIPGEYPRDYSVDKKSDALFREFSRCETDSARQHRITTYRRLRGHHPYAKLSEQRSTEYGSSAYVDDETTLASVPIITVAADEDSSDHV